MHKYLFILLFAASVHASVVNDLAGPSDYGNSIASTNDSLAGLTVGDTRQGQLDNCWFWSVLASIIHQNPAALAKNYAVQSDGSVYVTFYANGLPTTYHVTSAVNTYFGDPTTSNDDSNGDTAGDIVEKAFAAFRSPVNKIVDEDWGIPSEAMADFGLTTGVLPNSVGAIAAALALGDVVNVDTGSIVPSGAVTDHVYSVWSVNAANGTAIIRSPWGGGYVGYDEYLTVNDAWLNQYSDGVYYGQFGGASPPVPEPSSLAVLGAAMFLMKRGHLNA